MKNKLIFLPSLHPTLIGRVGLGRCESWSSILAKVTESKLPKDLRPNSIRLFRWLQHRRTRLPFPEQTRHFREGGLQLGLGQHPWKEFRELKDSISIRQIVEHRRLRLDVCRRRSGSTSLERSNLRGPIEIFQPEWVRPTFDKRCDNSFRSEAASQFGPGLESSNGFSFGRVIRRTLELRWNVRFDSILCLPLFLTSPKISEPWMPRKDVWMCPFRSQLLLL